MLPCSLLAENIFGISKSAPTPRYTILDSWLLLVMQSQKAGLPFATRARKRELSIREVRIENESDRKFSKSKNFRSFSENHFSPRFMLPCSLLAENIFLVFKFCTHPPRYTILDSRLLLVMRSRKAGLPFATRARKRELSIREVRIENVSDRKYSKSKFFGVFLKTIFIHVLCYPFLDFKVCTHPSIHNFGLLASPGNSISEGRPPLCNTSSAAGALDTGGPYRE